MDAFEQVIAGIFWNEGFWTQTSLKVELTKEEKREIGRPSSPRWELDVVAYSGARNELYVIECKSYLDSFGVQPRELEMTGGRGGRYKLFTEPDPLRRVVFHRLQRQLSEQGFCQPDTAVHLALACGKVHGEDGLLRLRELAREGGWLLIEPSWIKERLLRSADASYENEIASVVAKLLTRR